MVIELPTYLLVFFRTAAILWLLPIFPERAISAVFRIGVSLLIAFLLVGTVPASPSLAADPMLLILAIAKEVMIGLVIGFAVRLMVIAVQAAGEIVSLQTGFAFARVMDPVLAQQSTVLDQFYYLLAMMVFFAMDAHHMLLAGLAGSFRELPIGAASFSQGTLQYLVTGTGKVLSLGLRIGAPLIVALLLVELSLGLLSRMIPQMNIFFEGLPFKVFLTVTLLGLSLSYVVPFLADLFRTMGGEIGKLVRLLG